MPARKPPAAVARKRTRSTDTPIALAEAALSPAMRTISPHLVFLRAQAMATASTMPTKNSGLTSSACASAGLPVQSPRWIESRCGALGWMKGLPKKKARAGAEAHEGDADGDVVHLGQLADVAVHGAEHETGAAGGEHAQPRAAGEIRGGVGDHGAQHQRALEAEIDAAGFFGEGFAQRHEHERRRDPDGAAQHGDEDDDQRMIHQTRSPVFAGWKILKRP